MLALRRLIPPLTARTAAGQVVRAWDYKQKKNLLIAFLHSDCQVCEGFAARIASRSGELAERESVALLISLERPRWSVAGNPQIIIAWDTTGRAAEDYLGRDAIGASGLAQVGLFVADRYGELFAQWQGRDADGLPPVADAFKWLFHAQTVCEECSLPSWLPEE